MKIWAQIFYNHDLDHLRSHDIQMVTRIDCGGIRLASFNSLPPKTSHQMQRSWRYLLHNLHYSPFVSNFIAMATRVGQGKILLAVFDSPTPKTLLYMQRSRRYLQQKPRYSPLCPKFHCRGNQGESGVNLNETVRLTIPENHTIEPKITTLSYTQPKL